MHISHTFYPIIAKSGIQQHYTCDNAVVYLILLLLAETHLGKFALKRILRDIQIC